MKKIHLYTLLAFILLSCTDNNNLYQDYNSLDVSVLASEKLSRGIVTGTSFPAGSQIGVTVVATDDTPYRGTEYTNGKYTTNDGSVWFTDNRLYLYNDMAKTVAYYPYNMDCTDITALPVETRSQTDYMYSDWVTGINIANPDAVFKLKHVMSDFRVVISADEFNVGYRIDSIAVMSDALASSALLDLTDGTLHSLDVSDRLVNTTPAVLAAGGNTFDFLVLPSGEKASIDFFLWVEGREMQATVPYSEELQPGVYYTVELVVTSEGLQVSGYNISEWVEKDTYQTTFLDKENLLSLTYNITTTTNETSVLYSSTVTDNVSRMWVDNVEVAPTHCYTFPTTGSHNVKYEFTDNAIPENAFKNNTNLVKIDFWPKTLQVIGNYAFYGTKIEGPLDFPDALVTIGTYAFMDCTSITGDLVLPEACTSVGNYAFNNCWRLTSLYIPASVTSIGGYTFSKCSGLQSIAVNGGNTKYDSRNNCNAIMRTATNTLLQGCKNTVIPGNTWYINDYAFYESGLKGNLSLPSGLIDIGDYAFYYCSDLTGSLNLPSSCTSLGSYAFYNCNGFNKLYLSEVNSIPSYCFYNCRGFNNSIYIPNSVTSIGDYAFYNCYNLYGYVDAKNCTAIGDYAFYMCEDITSFSFGSSLQTIGYYAFQYCSSLEYIYTERRVAPSITRYTFRNVSENGILSVPYGASDNYSTWLSSDYYYLGYFDWSIEERAPMTGTIDLSTASNGVYAVAQNGLGVQIADADASCIGVAIISGTYRFMLDKSDAGTAAWGDLTNTSLTDYSTEIEALNDFNGYANSQVLLGQTGMGTLLQTYRTSTGDDSWYIPSMGQFDLIFQNKSNVNTCLANIGGGKMNSYYWTSNEKDANNGYEYYWSGNKGSYSKTYNNFVRFIKNL